MLYHTAPGLMDLLMAVLISSGESGVSAVSDKVERKLLSNVIVILDFIHSCV